MDKRLRLVRPLMLDDRIDLRRRRPWRCWQTDLDGFRCILPVHHKGPHEAMTKPGSGAQFSTHMWGN